MKARDYLQQLGTTLQAEFETNRRVMSFEEYLDLVTESPRHHVRTASQYLLDCFHYFGSTSKDTPLGEIRSWNLFDSPFEDGKDKLIGQESAQESVYRILQNFARQRRVNKLILLHGPNGSAKSSLLGCIARALEAYSRTDEGAIYCFNWVFPSRKVAKKALGFGNEGAEKINVDSYAYLDDEQIDAQIPGDLRDHPLLLLPTDARRELLETAFAGTENEEFLLGELFLSGELAPRNRQIAELLYNNSRGDITSMLQHVQVERFFISRRYRRGAVTVEPQLQVDASVRQLTGDRSLTSLPLVMQSTTLYEPFGDLVDGHRGLIEYNDLLKRPLESFKYLLATCEKSSVALPNQILHLDLAFFASSNETHLAAFKEYPDWPSFKARIELVRVGYLRSYQTEQRIYDEQVTSDTVQKRIAPHASFVAALWAVLTRLRKPKPDQYPKTLRGTIASLSPIQKAELYTTGRAPKGLAIEKTRNLKAHIQQLANEEREDASYEGQYGASPREMKLVLLNAAQNSDFPALTPLAVLAEIESLTKQKTVYEFLRTEPVGQFHDYAAFIEVAKTRWLDLADDELTRAMGLVTRDQYDELFQRYLTHVGHAGRKEKIYNNVTGKFEEPDYKFMEEMEKHFQVDKGADDFRSEILGRIGAASQNKDLASQNYRDLFPNLFDHMEGSYYDAQKTTIFKIAKDMLTLITREGSGLSVADKKRAEEALDHLVSDFDYCEFSAREMISTLLGERYAA